MKKINEKNAESEITLLFFQPMHATRHIFALYILLSEKNDRAVLDSVCGFPDAEMEEIEVKWMCYCFADGGLYGEIVTIHEHSYWKYWKYHRAFYSHFYDFAIHNVEALVKQRKMR